MRSRTELAWAWAMVVGVAVFTTAAVVWTGRADPSRVGPPTAWAATIDPVDARAILEALPVVDPAPEVAYDRIRDFGPAWADLDGNGCDTRNDILARDLSQVRFAPGTGDCKVTAGWMLEPYTGRPVKFSSTDPSAVQIDHLIPLHAAWQLGAWAWEPGRRLEFANDPANLVAVDGPANQAKGDALADTWRPANRAVHCVYAVNTVAVHGRYALGVTNAERRALDAMLATC